METDRAAWLAGLKAGDEVAVERTVGMAAGVLIGALEKRTPKGRLTVDLGNYKLTFDALGREIGGGYTAARLQPVTQQTRDRIEQEHLVYKLGIVKWHTLPLPVLRRVMADLEEQG